MTWAEAANMQDIWITHSWSVRTKRSLTIPLFISTLVSWRLRPIHDGRVFCCFSEQRKAEGGREESSCYIEELAHTISSLLTHWKDAMIICPCVWRSKSHEELSVSITEGQDLISYVRKVGGGNFYPLSCLLIMLFLNIHNLAKHWTPRTVSFCFQFVLSPHWLHVIKEAHTGAPLSEWVWDGCLWVSETIY